MLVVTARVLIFVVLNLYKRMLGIIGKKIGMSQVVLEDGKVLPVTFIATEPNDVVQVKTVDNDGYAAVVLGCEPYKNPSKNKKYKKIKEFRIEENAEFKKGDKVGAADFAEMEKVTVTSVSKGKGFQGNIKRHNFAIARETHGTKYTRHGSTGACAMPGRTKPGQKMPGRMGRGQVTLRDRQVVLVDVAKNVIAVKGSVPGATNTYVYIKA